MAGQTVRDAAFDVLREHGLTTLFANPGSTEISLLADLPGDLRFVLGLHESSVVGMATGWAIGRGEPALAILHTTPGLGNAVSALATARVNRAPLVVLVGQQDRRHLAAEPFLAGKLHGLAGEYPVWVDQPVRAQDVPGAIARAHHEATTGRGPALVIVPMDDWAAEAGPADERAAPRRVVRARGADDAARRRARRAPRRCRAAGARRRRRRRRRRGLGGARRARRAARVPGLAGVVQRAGPASRRTTRCSRATSPADRPRLRAALAAYDVVLAVGAPVFRQYAYAPGPFVEPGHAVAMVSQDPAEVHRSAADLAVLASPGRRVRGAGARRAGPRRRDGRAFRAPGGARSAGPGRAAPRGARLRRASPSACRATRSSSRRAPRTGPSCSCACRRASRSAL